MRLMQRWKSKRNRGLEENTVNMAVGMIWQDEATTELDILLQETEKRMYADKAEYYRKNGIERRRR